MPSRVRLYSPNDVDLLCAYLDGKKHSVKPDRDVVIVGDNGPDTPLWGVSAGCPAFLVHHLTVNHTLAALHHATSLVHFGVGVLADRGLRKFTFFTQRENQAMIRFMQQMGANELPGDLQLFSLNL